MLGCVVVPLISNAVQASAHGYDQTPANVSPPGHPLTALTRPVLIIIGPPSASGGGTGRPSPRR